MESLLFAGAAVAMALFLVTVVSIQRSRRAAQIRSMPEEGELSRDITERLEVVLKAQRYYVSSAAAAVAAQGSWLLTEAVASLAVLGENVRPTMTPLEAKVSYAVARTEMEAAMEIYQAALDHLMEPSVQRFRAKMAATQPAVEDPSAVAAVVEPKGKLPN